MLGYYYDPTTTSGLPLAVAGLQCGGIGHMASGAAASPTSTIILPSTNTLAVLALMAPPP